VKCASMLSRELLVRSDFTEVRRLYRAGDFAACHAALDQLIDEPQAALERAKLLLRERRYADCVAHLSRAQAPFTPAQQAERCILLGAGHCHAANFHAAQLAFAEAEALVDVAGDPELKFLLANQRGVAAWMLHDYDRALEEAATLESSADDNHRGLGYSLRSWVEIGRGDAVGQAKWLLRALDQFEKAAQRDEVFVARTLFTLGALCREIVFPKATKRLRASAVRVRWTDGLALERFQIARLLGWIEALSGNELASFRYLKESARLAPSTAWKILALLDRASLAKSRGEEAFALDQLHDAHALAAEVRWETTHGEERSPLLILAELFAGVDPSQSSAYLEKFRSLLVLESGLAYASDRRIAAFMGYSAGIAHQKLGNPTAALEALTDSWSAFESFSYGWRSALAAAAIYELTASGTWLSRARDRATSWPHSWIARKIDQLNDEKPATVKLTPNQRRVYEALLEGRSTEAIAKKLGRSPNTVRNHISAIFLAFHVNSRARLLSKSFGLSTLQSVKETSLREAAADRVGCGL